MARPFCSSSPRMRDGCGTCGRSASRAAVAAARVMIIGSGCRGFIGPCPSAPLDEVFNCPVSVAHGQRRAGGPLTAVDLALAPRRCLTVVSAAGGTMGAVSDERRDPPGPPPLVLISGDEPFLVDRAVQRTVAAARRIDPDVERREAMAGGMVPGEFDDLVAPSLFAEPRVVVAAGRAGSRQGARRRRCAHYCADPVDGVTLSSTTPAAPGTRRWRTR